MPYLPFPEHWPVFAPKDKIGDWLEMYTKVMELNYWSSSPLASATYDEHTSGTTEKLTSQITAFPEGQHVAVDQNGRIVASSSALIIDWDDYAKSARWSEITDHGTFSTHNPLGKTLYGADIGVDPAARRQGIGSLFYEVRKGIVKERGLKRMLTSGRIPGYAQVAGQLSPREYVAEVVMGKRTDPTLSFQFANGFVVLDVVPSYIEDKDSGGFATLLEWLNPAYVTSLSSQTHEERATVAELGEASLRERLGPRRVRIAAMQYLLVRLIVSRTSRPRLNSSSAAPADTAATSCCSLSSLRCSC